MTAGMADVGGRFSSRGWHMSDLGQDSYSGLPFPHLHGGAPHAGTW